MPPGPDESCLTCRKRQVRCDGSKPTCSRCPKDGRECRGYKGQLRIVQVNPVKSAKAIQQKPVIEQKPRDARFDPIAVPQFPLSLGMHIFVSDRDMWTLVDCAKYWNNNIIPSTFPAERPFFRPYIMGDEIAVQPIPKICLHFVIVAFRATQAARLLIDPFTQPDLCYYRGLGLRALPKYLQDAATDPSGVALMSIVMLMTSDVIAPDNTWLVHLDAARRIVDLRGGMGACISSLPDSIFVLTQLYLIDTLTSTTCKGSELPETSLADTIGDVPNIDFQLITCASTCPAEILQVMARTSSLRRHQASGAVILYDDESLTRPSVHDAILDELKKFDCSAWATRISHLGLSYPIEVSNVAPCSSTDGLTSVAECFRSATMVYLLLSCNAVVDEQILQEVRRASQSLHRELNTLFDNASQDWNKPLDTQLWKFVSWPLVVSMYAWVGWDIEEDDIYLETLFSRSKLIAAVKGTLSRPGAEKLMREVKARRAASPTLCWTWDMGFSDRSAFVL